MAHPRPRRHHRRPQPLRLRPKQPPNLHDPLSLFKEGLYGWYQRSKTTLSNTWSSPRFQGGLRMFGGAAEMGAGLAVSGLSGGAAAPAGLAIGVHEFDHFTAGLRSVVTGQHHDTFTCQGLQKTGISPEKAYLIDNTASAVATLAGGVTLALLKGPAVFRLSTPIKNISNPLQGTKYSKKVLFQMENNLKTGKPDFHGFPRMVDNYAGLGKSQLIKGRDGISRVKVHLDGGYKGSNGHFEWIIESDKSVNHRLFVPHP